MAVNYYWKCKNKEVCGDEVYCKNCVKLFRMDPQDDYTEMYNQIVDDSSYDKIYNIHDWTEIFNVSQMSIDVEQETRLYLVLTVRDS